MNVLDENIIAPERARLRAWRIHFRSIGEEVGRLGMKDQNDIIPITTPVEMANVLHPRSRLLSPFVTTSRLLLGTSRRWG